LEDQSLEDKQIDLILTNTGKSKNNVSTFEIGSGFVTSVSYMSIYNSN